MANKERQGPDSSQVTQDQDLFKQRARLLTPDELEELGRRVSQALEASEERDDKPVKVDHTIFR